MKMRYFILLVCLVICGTSHAGRHKQTRKDPHRLLRHQLRIAGIRKRATVAQHRKVAAQVIEAYYATHITEKQQTSCPICQKRLKKNRGYYFRCSHAMHTKCFVQHLQRSANKKCPCCRAALKNVPEEILDSLELKIKHNHARDVAEYVRSITERGFSITHLLKLRPSLLQYCIKKQLREELTVLVTAIQQEEGDLVDLLTGKSLPQNPGDDAPRQGLPAGLLQFMLQ